MRKGFSRSLPLPPAPSTSAGSLVLPRELQGSVVVHLRKRPKPWDPVKFKVPSCRAVGSFSTRSSLFPTSRAPAVKKHCNWSACAKRSFRDWLDGLIPGGAANMMLMFGSAFCRNSSSHFRPQTKNVSQRKSSNFANPHVCRQAVPSCADPSGNSGRLRFGSHPESPKEVARKGSKEKTSEPSCVDQQCSHSPPVV